MRILPHYPVLHRRGRLSPLKTAAKAVGLGSIAVACGSCAKFPANNAAGNFTAFTFTFQVASQINTGQNGAGAYVYDVAIRPVFKLGSPPDNGVNSNPAPTYAPVPTVSPSNPNGRMNGSPNVFIEFTPGSIPEFTLYRFALSSEIPNPNDPTNPVNLAVYAVSTRGVVVNTQSPLDGDDPTTLSFTVYANELVDNDADAQYIQYLQVNVLSMTRPSNLGSGARVIDALGNTSAPGGLTSYLQVTAIPPTPVNNSNNLEPTGDTVGGVDPAIDLTNFSVNVTAP